MKFLSFVLLSSFLTLSANADVLLDRNYSNVKNFLGQVVADSNGKAELVTIGDSDSKEKILGIKIGSGSVHNLVVATHHGNEYGSTEVALAFAAAMAKSPAPEQTLFVVPVLNIQGYNSRNRYERAMGGSSVDPNRDYPGPCGTDGPFHLQSTKALATFVEKEKIVNSATLHTFQPAVVYPWGFSTHDTQTAYPDIFTDMVKNATEFSGYEIGNSGEVIYPADGTFEDYAFYQNGIWSILFELGFSHSPSQDEVQKMIDVNVPGLQKMFANAPKALAQNHAFTGKCDFRLKSLDKHDE